MLRLEPVDQAATHTSTCACMQACQLAADWRLRYETDCVVDIVGYRRCSTQGFTPSSFYYVVTVADIC